MMKHTKLIWGVKESFRQYVEAVEGTSRSLMEPTARGWHFRFQSHRRGKFRDRGRRDCQWNSTISGTAIFEAHGGMLKSVISGLAIESGPEGITLSALEGPLNESRCHIAKLQCLRIAGIVFSDSALKSPDGMFQIADNYLPGTILDDVTLA